MNRLFEAGAAPVPSCNVFVGSGFGPGSEILIGGIQLG